MWLCQSDGKRGESYCAHTAGKLVNRGGPGRCERKRSRQPSGKRQGKGGTRGPVNYHRGRQAGQIQYTTHQDGQPKKFQTAGEKLASPVHLAHAHPHQRQQARGWLPKVTWLRKPVSPLFSTLRPGVASPGSRHLPPSPMNHPPPLLYPRAVR